jgi:phosphohistidine phosphatase
MNLYLMRHGEAEPLEHEDAPRCLTALGKLNVKDVARQFALRDIALTACLHSPYLRTTQTCTLFLAELAASVQPQVLELLTPETRAADVLNYLQTLQAEHVLVITHNPLVSELLTILTDSEIRTMHIFATSELNALHCATVSRGGASLQFRLNARA